MSNACLLLLGDHAHKIWQVKFILVPALRYYFLTFVQQCRLLCGDDHKFLCQIEVTSLGQVRVHRRLSQYIPTHAEDFTLTFEGIVLGSVLQHRALFENGCSVLFVTYTYIYCSRRDRGFAQLSRGSHVRLTCTAIRLTCTDNAYG